VLIFALLNEFRTGNYEIAPFFIARPGMGLQGWGIIVLTVPAVACCAYSLALAITRRFTRG
jgi:hypothetical protein